MWHPRGTRDTLVRRVPALYTQAMWHPCTLKSKNSRTLHSLCVRNTNRSVCSLRAHHLFAFHDSDTLETLGSGLTVELIPLAGFTV